MKTLKKISETLPGPAGSTSLKWEREWEVGGKGGDC